MHLFYRLWQNNQDGELVLDFGYQGDLKLVLLINNIKPDIAEEVKMCWIDPKSFTLGHLLGHGKTENTLHPIYSPAKSNVTWFL